jgi:hydroxypyruvate isomerase
VGQDKVWMREIRRRTKSGHQTSVLSTHDGLEQGHLAASMFARWSQENFFRYMREHCGLDRIVDYCLDEIPDTTKVVNPTHRHLDGQVRKKVGELTKKQAQFGALELQGDIEKKNVEAYERAKTALHEEVTGLQSQVAKLKEQRRAAPRHITVAELPEEHRFKQLSTDSKHFVDTVKMIAYRAETAMASMLRERLARSMDTRTLLRSVYQNEADLVPDDKARTLTVRLHNIANESESAAIRLLCEQLNETETVFPGTEYRLVYEMGSSKIPRGQEP